ncbi:MAG: response regulator [Proteobacteria bacterium]|nr:response regulator [Pseudomonadota bacterium]
MPKKILVLDDDPHIVSYLQSLFSDNGYETCSASGGEEGLDVLKRERPDLITLDLDMPGDAGPMFYRKMSREDEFKDLPVIVISGLSGAHRAIKKVVASLSKPFDSKELLTLVRNTIGQ